MASWLLKRIMLVGLSDLFLVGLVFPSTSLSKATNIPQADYSPGFHLAAIGQPTQTWPYAGSIGLAVLF
jgi:hypothetical protein